MSETDERSIADRGTLDRGLALARQMGGQLISLYSTVQLIEQARRLDAEVDQSLRLDTHQVNSLRQALRNLIAMYHELERRITDAPLDESGLPQLDGIRWSPGSPNAGQALDILPFGKLDLWTRLLNNLPQSRPERRRRRRPGRRSEPVVPVINPDLPSVDGAQVAEDLSGTPEDFSLTNGVLTTVRGILAGVGLVGQVSGVAALATAGFFAAFIGYVVMRVRMRESEMARKTRKSEAHFRSVVDNVPGAIFQWVVEGANRYRFSYMSPRCFDIFGFKSEDVIRDWEYLHLYPVDQAKFLGALNAAVRPWLRLASSSAAAAHAVKWIKTCAHWRNLPCLAWMWSAARNSTRRPIFSGAPGSVWPRWNKNWSN